MGVYPLVSGVELCRFATLTGYDSGSNVADVQTQKERLFITSLVIRPFTPSFFTQTRSGCDSGSFYLVSSRQPTSRPTDTTRAPRHSQFIIVPPFQKQGHGCTPSFSRTSQASAHVNVQPNSTTRSIATSSNDRISRSSP